MKRGISRENCRLAMLLALPLRRLPETKHLHVPAGQAAPRLGADTREVLADIGYNETDIEALVASGAAMPLDATSE